MKSRRANNGHRASTPHWLPLLAAAVVQQAIVDAGDPSLPETVRRDARRFLSGSPDYHLWGQLTERQFN
jgi:hypothetical protein